MKSPEYFEEIAGVACFRPVGEVALPEASRLVTEAITYAREAGFQRLLVNLTGMRGYPSPTLAERYFISREWAAAARSRLRVAIVVPLEMIDPEKFGVMVARNAGMDADVFAVESEALAWLRSGPAS